MSMTWYIYTTINEKKQNHFKSFKASTIFNKAKEEKILFLPLKIHNLGSDIK